METVHVPVLAMVQIISHEPAWNRMREQIVPPLQRHEKIAEATTAFPQEFVSERSFEHIVDALVS